MSSHVNQKVNAIITPTQKRGREMQARLVQATLELLENQIFEEISVADITQQAGVAVGTFYRRFTSKEALLPLLYEAYNVRTEKWFAAMVADEGFEAPERETRVRRVVTHLMEFCEDNRGLMRALHLNARLDNRIVPETANPERQSQYRLMADLIEPSGASDRQRDLAEAMVLMVVSTCVEYVLYPNQTPSVLIFRSREEMLDALTTASLALFENT